MNVRCEFCGDQYEIGHPWSKPERAQLILDYAQCPFCGFWRTEKGRLTQYEPRCFICGLPKSAVPKYLPLVKMCVSCFKRVDHEKKKMG